METKLFSRLDISVAETFGEEAESILQTAELWQKNVSAFFGPVETCIHEVILDRDCVYIHSTVSSLSLSI